LANAVALAEAIPDARLRVLDNAGHLVFIERFADVNREVVTFLKPRKPRKRAQRASAGGLGARFRGGLRRVRRWVEKVGTPVAFLLGPAASARDPDQTGKLYKGARATGRVRRGGQR
jgi:hypothetical protein